MLKTWTEIEFDASPVGKVWEARTYTTDNGWIHFTSRYFKTWVFENLPQFHTIMTTYYNFIDADRINKNPGSEIKDSSLLTAATG